jgi:hypothetical protein
MRGNNNQVSVDGVRQLQDLIFRRARNGMRLDAVSGQVELFNNLIQFL